MPRKRDIAKILSSSMLRDTVYQANPLIQARKDFSAIQSRLFYVGLMAINPHLSSRDKFYDVEFPHTFVSPAAIAAIMGNDKYLSTLKQECSALFDTHITLDTKSGGWKLIHIFDAMEYENNQGLHVKFDDKMRPFLLDLVGSRGYTILNTEPIFKLSSPYAIRLLELLLQYRNMSGNIIHRSLTEEQLRFSLNVPDGAYAGRMNNFQAKVLNGPIKEINERTDFKMDYTVEREGRKIKKFNFAMDMSKIPDELFDRRAKTSSSVSSLPSPVLDNRVILNVSPELVNLGFSSASAFHIVRNCGSEEECFSRLQYAVKSLAHYRLTHEVDNELGFIRFAIEDNWKEKELLAKKEAAAKYRSRLLQQEMRLEAEACGVSISELTPNETVLYSDYAKKAIRELKRDGHLSLFSQELLDMTGWTLDRFKSVYMRES